MVSSLKNHPVLKIINRRLVDLPCPINISFWWNFGSLLSLCLRIQLVSGILLALHYSGDTNLAFERVSLITQDISSGWALRNLHANGASFFFFCLYFHVGRGIYYGSFNFHITWNIGVIILLLVIATAFLGYVLPWGQISFWGTTVITNLLSAIPYIGKDVVMWLWGGFAVRNPTLTRFFAFHFFLPFIVLRIVGIHLLFLHQTGSGNPLGLNSNIKKITFQPFFTFKDLTGALFLLLLLGLLSLIRPWILGDPENFITANPLVTPVHIQPEWYFLYAYAILRSIPNKLGGVVALVLAVLILIILSLPLFKTRIIKSKKFYPLRKFYFWVLTAVVILLTWIGARPVEQPYVFSGQILTFLYFTFFVTEQHLLLFWDYLNK